jgi:hypothetical protein
MENRFKFRFWNGEKWLYYDLFSIPKNISYVDKPYQCTDIIDKKDRLVYECDFVKVLIETTEFNSKHFGIEKPTYKIAEIVWRDYFFIFQFEPQLKMHPCYDTMCMLYCDIEIIGNRYENPELLKQKF